MFETDREAPFAPVDAEHDFAGARRKIGSWAENEESRTEMTDRVDLPVEVQFHLDLGGVSSHI